MRPREFSSDDVAVPDPLDRPARADAAELRALIWRGMLDVACGKRPADAPLLLPRSQHAAASLFNTWYGRSLGHLRPEALAAIRRARQAARPAPGTAEHRLAELLWR